MAQAQVQQNDESAELRRMLEEMTKAKEAAEAQLAKEKEKTAKVIYFKVSEKGGGSLYGIRRQFPITLYEKEWDAVFEMREKWEEFKAKHGAELSKGKPNGANGS